MNRIAAYVSGLTLGMVLAASANANLIVNGSFEDNEVAQGSWSYFSAGNVDGWSGSNIEIWNGLGGMEAAHGNQHAELNAHPRANVFSISQSFETVVNRVYELTFFYRARTGNNEAFSYSVAGLAGDLQDHVVGQWSLFEGEFMATSMLTELRFTTLSPGTTGNFIDGVAVSEVSEPGSLLLLSLGFLGVAATRKKINA